MGPKNVSNINSQSKRVVSFSCGQQASQECILSVLNGDETEQTNPDYLVVLSNVTFDASEKYYTIDATPFMILTDYNNFMLQVLKDGKSYFYVADVNSYYSYGIRSPNIFSINLIETNFLPSGSMVSFETSKVVASNPTDILTQIPTSQNYMFESDIYTFILHFYIEEIDESGSTIYQLIPYSKPITLSFGTPNTGAPSQTITVVQ